jgi:hypothetical protein
MRWHARESTIMFGVSVLDDGSQMCSFQRLHIKKRSRRTLLIDLSRIPSERRQIGDISPEGDTQVIADTRNIVGRGLADNAPCMSTSNRRGPRKAISWYGAT